MGRYINPPSGTKEQWLEQNAKAITADEFRALQFDNDLFGVCLTRQLAGFTSAAVCNSASELTYWQRLSKERPQDRKYYVAPAASVMAVSQG